MASEPKGPPNPVLSGLQSALIGGAFESFGKAFTDTGDRRGGRTAADSPGMENWRAAGREAGMKANQRLVDRWNKVEFDEFKKKHVDLFVEDNKTLGARSKDLSKGLNNGVWLGNPDGNPVELDFNKEEDRLKATQYRHEIQTDVTSKLADNMIALSSEAAKYGSNPLVDRFVQDLYQRTSGKLMGQFSNKGSMEQAQTMSGLRVDEAQIRQLDAAAEASKESTSSKKIDGPRSAWQNLGAQGISGWWAGEGREFWNPIWDEEATEEFVIGWKERNPGKANDIEAQNSAVANNSSRIQKLADGKAIAATIGPQARLAAAVYDPLIVPDPPGDRTVAVKGRLSEDQRKEKVDKWKVHGLNSLHAYMNNTEKDVTVAEALDYVMKEWLPKALTGKLNTDLYDDITTTDGQTTQQYRTDVMEGVLAYIQKFVGTGTKGGKAVRERKGILPHRRGPRGKGSNPGARVSRVLKGMFSDEDVYPRK